MCNKCVHILQWSKNHCKIWKLNGNDYISCENVTLYKKLLIKGKVKEWCGQTEQTPPQWPPVTACYFVGMPISHNLQKPYTARYPVNGHPESKPADLKVRWWMARSRASVLFLKEKIEITFARDPTDADQSCFLGSAFFLRLTSAPPCPSHLAARPFRGVYQQAKHLFPCPSSTTRASTLSLLLQIRPGVGFTLHRAWKRADRRPCPNATGRDLLFVS